MEITMPPTEIEIAIDNLAETWREIAEDMLIKTYVPEADYLSRKDALELALERDLAAATALEESVLDMKAAAEATKE